MQMSCIDVLYVLYGKEAHIVRCLAFHPSGDYLLVGTQHPTLRLYDVNTAQCFVSAITSDQHTGPITQVNYSPNASLYVTSSKDGDIRLWDGVSNRCINIFPRAHDGYEISSVAFSRNAKVFHLMSILLTNSEHLFNDR